MAALKREDNLINDAARRTKENAPLKRPLQESERYWYGLAMRTVSEATWILDAEGALRYVSPAVERILGYRPEELVGTLAWDYVHPEDLDRVANSFVMILDDAGVDTAYGSVSGTGFGWLLAARRG
jgi:PAS domain-containing protein